ncbi:dimethylarginine dimethylaminohydrolase family protein [Dokdonella sp. MW10]|uniref:dimethylarginine dimethylaminohydrolase family protein n=1 Tax=Dokdonella sp. MW10 TaxID=2992926 RepID=UPI003F81FEFE
MDTASIPLFDRELDGRWPVRPFPTADASRRTSVRASGVRARLLLCAPAHFEVSYVINPWMAGNEHRTDPARALAQWQGLRDVLERHASVETVAPVEGLPDMPFTANAGLVRGRTFVPSRFTHAQRRGEEAPYTTWFREQGYAIAPLAAGVTFEGAGDALFDHALDVLWMGHGHRTQAAAAAALQGVVDAEVVPLRLVDERFYHLDTCFCPLPGGVLLWHPEAFDAESRRHVETRIPQRLRVAVDDRDAEAFACNAVSLGTAVVVHRASGKLKHALDGLGLTVVETPLDEFIKAGGSAKCLTLALA